MCAEEVDDLVGCSFTISKTGWNDWSERLAETKKISRSISKVSSSITNRSIWSPPTNTASHAIMSSQA